MTIEYSYNKVDKVAFLKDYSFLNKSDKNENYEFIINPKIDLIEFDSSVEFNNLLNELINNIEDENIKNEIIKINSNDDEINENENIKNKLNELKSIAKKQIDSQEKEIEIENNKRIELKLNEVINEIESLNGIDKNKIDIVIYAENPIFSDIKFTIDKSKVKLTSRNIKQNIMSGATLGSSNMLDAISEQKFAVILGRKTANLRNLQNQNHDCIDALVQNGLMGSPKIMTEYSIGKILNKLSKLNLNFNVQKFNFYIIHQALQVNNLEYNGILKYNVPVYSIGEGEILSVFFRYIAILFFPYLSITNISDDEYKYDL